MSAHPQRRKQGFQPVLGALRAILHNQLMKVKPRAGVWQEQEREV